MTFSYYEILNVPPGATRDEIVAAYRKLFLERHPDRIPADQVEDRQKAEDLFTLFTEAFAMLSQPWARAQYDALLRGEQPFAKKRRWLRRNPAPRQPELALPETPDEALRQERLKGLRRKRNLLIAAGIALCLAPFGPLLMSGIDWAQATGMRAWWRTSSLASNTDAWFVEKLRFYPVTDGEKKGVPDAVVTLRGYVKGLDSCYVIPARGTVVEENGNRATIRVEMQRLGSWNKEASFFGTCTENFAPIEAYLAGNIKAWETIDLVAVDTDTGLERVFPSAEVQWHIKR